ncbi:MAG: UDP-2,3-diacylglucosamine diphosphatase [Planctomycetota bacterium]
MKQIVLASDFHLSPSRPEGIRTFVRFCREVAAGSDRFYILGDLFNFWVGPGNLGVPGLTPALDELRSLSDSGVELTILHGNRDFLMGSGLARRTGAVIPGEEIAVELFGRRYLLLHGDSLCTHDLSYQRSKRFLRCGLLHLCSRVMPLSVSLWIAGRLRTASRKSVRSKAPWEMEIADEAVVRRFEEGFDALVCGHVHRPGTREYGFVSPGYPVHVLGAWDPGGVFGRIDADGLRLEFFPGPDPSRT